MPVAVAVLAVLLAGTVVALLVTRRRLGAARSTTRVAEARVAEQADELSSTAAARDEAAAARVAADDARAAAEAERGEAEARARTAEEQAAAEAERAARAYAEREQAQLEAEAAATARVEAEGRLAAFERRAAATESGLAAAAEAVDRATASAPPVSGDLDAQVLWALEKSRTERTWRHSVAVDPSGSPFSDAGVALTEAVQVELDAAREDVGADIDLDADVPDGLTAAGAVLTLRVVQELVADIVRRAETTTLRLQPDGDTDLLVTVDATDEDGQPVPPSSLPIPPSGAVESVPGGARIRNAIAGPSPD